jgi:EAL domain-containing protein (putative c-di-GMP-specific phosphodiesterase class I)
MNADLLRVNFESMSVVFKEGDPGDKAYVIEKGCVEVLHEAEGKIRRVAILSQGAIFGEIALLDGQPRTATVRTLMPTTLISIDRDHVHELLKRSDPVIQLLLGLLLERFRRSQFRETDIISALAGDNAVSIPENDLHAAALRTFLLAQDLSYAIDRGQLELYYQPLCVFHDLSLTGYEALIRWNHPTLGLVQPLEFISIAEKTGLIHRIGHWVLNQALSDWTELRTHCESVLCKQPFISINLSAPELSLSSVSDLIREGLERYRVPPGELRIELTETIIIDNMDSVFQVLKVLNEMGVGISLDDFGTGYAGLDYLRTLPFSCIKIDKSFVQQMNYSQRSLEIVRVAIDLAKLLKLKTIAEGIEDEATGLVLTEMGCDIAQGYYYAKPMPKKQIAEWLVQHRRKYASSK